MYENLVKRLRVCASDSPCLDCPERFSVGRCFDNIKKEAADAIEEVNFIAESNRRSMEAWAAESARAHDMIPRWIPVTEQKPPLPEDEDICFVDVIAAIRGRKESAQVQYCRAYRYRDGKRERIEVFVGDGEVLEVTHWMPMPMIPQTPKEEDNG